MNMKKFETVIGYSFNDEGDLDNPKNRFNLQYSKKRLSQLKAFCDANPQENTQDVIDFIVNTLRDRTVYNLRVDAPPEGKDFIEYFFCRLSFKCSIK